MSQCGRLFLFPLGAHKLLIKKFKEAEIESKETELQDLYLLVNCK